MKYMPVYAYGNKILRTDCKPVELNQDTKDLVQKMFNTLEVTRGVGIAAPQVGVNARIFVANAYGFKEAFINPEIIETEGTTRSEEGCLSIPGLFATIDRAEKVKVKFYDENLEEREEWFDRFPAKVIQHEYDHINGVLFIDHVNENERSRMKHKLKRILRGKPVKPQPRYEMVFKK